ncbi:MAG: 3-deoxy-manno-octulosonate cytidylyltransferase [Candidatus Muirbacterium halophilum]|nr:3-deoxy-manno-octulosonate cytidylyltransferase [Candidatus Muirbacterium halophilum]MCK9475751.1 3-deoxy-manno-octulosonate cytidylyltransferase [Candidatus Muirbacterium halophilum]
MNIVIVIPARIASTRLPQKPLKMLCGKTIINRVYEKALETGFDVVVATDSKLILEHVESFNGKAILTRDDHNSGTDRIAEVCEKIKADIYINVQGDEPFIRKDMILKAVEPFKTGFKGVSTLKTKIVYKEDINNPNTVKVVSDYNNNALYFSRSPIPYNRDNVENVNYYKHIGLYVYDKDTLKNITSIDESELESIEKLEQLRAMQNNIKIKVFEVVYDGVEINTPEDLKKAEEYIKTVSINL